MSTTPYPRVDTQPERMAHCTACPSVCIDADRCMVDGCATHYCAYHSDSRCAGCNEVCCWKHRVVAGSESMCPVCARKYHEDMFWEIRADHLHDTPCECGGKLEDMNDPMFDDWRLTEEYGCRACGLRASKHVEVTQERMRELLADHCSLPAAEFTYEEGRPVPVPQAKPVRRKKAA